MDDLGATSVLDMKEAGASPGYPINTIIPAPTIVPVNTKTPASTVAPTKTAVPAKATVPAKTTLRVFEFGTYNLDSNDSPELFKIRKVLHEDKRYRDVRDVLIGLTIQEVIARRTEVQKDWPSI